MLASIARRTEPPRLTGVERAPRAPRPPRPRVHARLHGHPRGAGARCRVGVPDVERPRSARLISAHRPTVPIYALSPGRETVRRCGLMWGVQAASMKRYEITEELIARRPSASSSSAGASPATASASPPACRPASRARPRCCRSKRCERVLFRPADLEGIAAGTDHAGLPAVGQAAREGGAPTLKTPVGVSSSRRSRWSTRSGRGGAGGGVLVAGGDRGADAQARAVYRVGLHLGGAGPAGGTAETPPDDGGVRGVGDGYPWTYEYCGDRRRPEVRAADLAESFGRETAEFKRDVRRLKESG